MMATRTSAFTEVTGSEDESTQFQAFMALKSSASQQTSIAKEPARAEDWMTLDVPSHNPKFSTGTFRGKSFMDVATEFPAQYFQATEIKGQLPKQMQEFREWVDIHFEVDGKDLRRKSVAAPAQR